MSFMSAISGHRDKAYIRRAYAGQKVENYGTDMKTHFSRLDKIARNAADSDLGIASALEAYDEYIREIEGADTAFEDQVDAEGSDPGLDSDGEDDEDV